MKNKIEKGLVLSSILIVLSLGIAFAEIDANNTIIQNESTNQTMNDTINQTMNDTINQTMNDTLNTTNPFENAKGRPSRR